MDELIDAGTVLYYQHFIGYLGDVLRRYFEPGLLVRQEVLYTFYFGKFEEGVEVALCVKEDIQGLDLFTALGCEIGRVALKDMGEVGSQPIDLIRAESMHVILRHQGSFTLLDPGELDLFMTMEVGIKMRQYIFLHNNGLVVRNRDGELQYFHTSNIGISQILP